MFTSIVKAGMRAITPRGKTDEHEHEHEHEIGVSTHSNVAAKPKPSVSSSSTTQKKDIDIDIDINTAKRQTKAKTKAKTKKENAPHSSRHSVLFPTTPKAFSSQASIPTPSTCATASTMDITANTTITMEQLSTSLLHVEHNESSNYSNNINNNNNNMDHTIDDRGNNNNNNSMDSNSNTDMTMDDTERKNKNKTDDTALVPSKTTAVVTSTSTSTPFANTTSTSTSITTSATQTQTPSASTTSPAKLWEVLDRQLRSNIGTSVRCGICLCTVINPVRTQCSHGFCKSCITGYLRSSSASTSSTGNASLTASATTTCPLCKGPCTKRSLEDFDALETMADAYKGMLRAFGFAPGTYTPEITTMTQKVDLTSYNCNDDADNDDDDDSDGDNENNDDSALSRFHRLCVATTYQVEALPVCASNHNSNNNSNNSTNKKMKMKMKQHQQSVCSKLQIEENKQVVAANFVACFGDNGDDEENESDGDDNDDDDETDTATMTALLESSIRKSASCRLHQTTTHTTKPTTATATTAITTTNTTTNTTKPKSPLPSQGCCSLPNTQDVQEQAREQLEADREMQESMETEPHNENDTETNTQQLHDETETNTNTNTGSESTTTKRQHQQLQQQQRIAADDEDDFFTLRKKTKLQGSVTTDSGSEQLLSGNIPSASVAFPSQPPIFARAANYSYTTDTNTNTNTDSNKMNATTGITKKHTRKSFSRRDLDLHPKNHPNGSATPNHRYSTEPKSNSSSSSSSTAETSDDKQSPQLLSFGGDDMSPIDHESSYWTIDGPRSSLSTSKRQSSPLMLSRMLEDSRGGLHMMPMTSDKGNQHASGDGEESHIRSSDGENNGDCDNDDDKTIAMTMDYSPAFSRETGGRKNDGNSSDSNMEHKNDESPSSSNNGGDGPHDPFPLTYDPIGNPTEITEDFHVSTKTEISNVANLPAGPLATGEGKSELMLPTKTKLFPSNNSVAPNGAASTEPAKNDSDETSYTSSSSDAKEEPCRGARSSPVDEWPIGTVVNVQARTWPGVNKQGGVGRITGRNPDGTYNVAYVLGGRESSVETIFVSKEDQGDDDTIKQGRVGSRPLARKRRVRAGNAGLSGLPEELLKKLAEEGFDIPGHKTKPKAKRKGTTAKAKPRAANQASVLSDATNGTTHGSASGRSKRKRNVAAEIISQSSNQPRGRRNQTKHARKASADLPKTVKKTREPTLANAKKTPAKKTVTWGTTESSRGAKRKDPPSAVTISMTSPLSEVANEEAMKIAETFYTQRLEEAIRNDSMVVVASNLSEADKAILWALVGKTWNETGPVLKFAQTVDDSTTLCVVPSRGNTDSDKDVASVRTLKVMMSALRGIPLVTPDWVRSCYLQKNILLPNRFLRTMPTKEEAIERSGETLCGVSRLAVAFHNNNNSNTKIETKNESGALPLSLSLPFEKMFVCLCGNYQGKTTANLRELLEAGGAEILSHPDEVETKLNNFMCTEDDLGNIAIVCGVSRGSSTGSTPAKQIRRHVKAGVLKSLRSGDRQAAPLLPRKVVVVDSQWVIESVTCAKALPPDMFEPSILKDLWKLCL